MGDRLVNKELIKGLNEKVYLEEVYKGYLIGSRRGCLNQTEYVVFSKKFRNSFIGDDYHYINEKFSSNSLVECRKYIKRIGG